MPETFRGDFRSVHAVREGIVQRGCEQAGSGSSLDCLDQRCCEIGLAGA
jgi:hypothetical protein